MSEPPNPDEAIQAHLPAQFETGIQANRPADAVPPGLQKAAFLARLRNLLELHEKHSRSRPLPGMWWMVQVGALVFAALVAGGTAQSMSARNLDPDLIGWTFVLLFLPILLLPDICLRLSRRAEQTSARIALEDYIIRIAESFPEEVEHCGGLAVLADHVELEALIRVVEKKYPDEPMGSRRDD
jgi:hypothetical protein